MHPTFLAILLSITAGFFYVLVWRIPLTYHNKSNSIQILLGSFVAILLLLLFSWLQPKFFLFLLEKYTSNASLIFYRSDIWVFAFFGFMEGLFCFIPLVSWFDANTYNNPLFQKKNTKGLIAFSFSFIVLPFFIAFHSFTSFGSDTIKIVSYFNPYTKHLHYSKVSALKIESENRISSNTKGQSRHYSVIILSLLLKDNSNFIILETEEANDLLAFKTANLIRHLEKRNIKSEIPSLLIGYSDWRNKLDFYYKGE